MSVLKLNQIQTANGVIMANLNSSGANTGFQLPYGLAPCVAAYNNGTFTVSASTNTALVADAKQFDTGGCFNATGSTATLNGVSVPAYSFGPNIAGYYLVTVGFWIPTAASGNAFTKIYKNGSQYRAGGSIPMNGTNSMQMTTTGVVYMNGTSDYLQGYVYHTYSGSLNFNNADPSYNYFNAALIRSA